MTSHPVDHARVLPQGWTVQDPQEAAWQQIAPGIQALALSPGLLLVDFTPNTAWPGVDIHADGPEELTIVEGGIHLHIPDTPDVYAATGARVRAEQGTQHSPVAGPDGCRLLARYPSI